MTEGRRGNEISDMSVALRAHAAKGNPTKEQQAQRRRLFQRIIQYLTIGIDMSPLFSDVISVTTVTATTAIAIPLTATINTSPRGGSPGQTCLPQATSPPDRRVHVDVSCMLVALWLV